MIGVLVSIYCELKPDFSINIESNFNNTITNNSYLISKQSNIKDKRESSYDLKLNSSKNTIMNIINKSQNNSFNNLNKIIVNTSSDEIKKKEVKSRPEEDEQTNLDNTIICVENYKSPDLSSVSNNIFSPASYRGENEKSAYNYNVLNLSNLNSKLNTSNMNFNKTILTGDNFNEMSSNNILNNIDSLTDFKLYEESGEYNQMISKLKFKAAQLHEEKDRIRKLNEEIFKNRDSN